jgi:predicted nucleic acid-binding protein
VPVVDASAAVEYLLGTALGRRIGTRLDGVEMLDAPHVIDLEVAAAFRRLVAAGAVAAARASEALVELAEMPLRRYPASVFLPRVWELRDTHTPYDAAYVALAEALASPLVTVDARLARSHGHRAEIELMEL